MQALRTNDAKPGATREQVGEVEMIGMRVRLQTPADTDQIHIVHLGGSHDVRAQIDEQVIIDQG